MFFNSVVLNLTISEQFSLTKNISSLGHCLIFQTIYFLLFVSDVVYVNDYSLYSVSFADCSSYACIKSITFFKQFVYLLLFYCFAEQRRIHSNTDG